MDKKVFYFSGTGNSYLIAKHIQRELTGNEPFDIAQVINGEKMEVKSSLIGFVFPLYFYGLPRIIEDFLSKVDLSGVSYCFALVTAMYPDGLALSQLEKLLAKKGVVLHTGMYIRMPNNYIIKHSVNSLHVNKKIITKALKKTDVMIDVVKSRKPLKYHESRVYNWALRSQKVYTKWRTELCELNRYFYQTDACNGCGKCRKDCPVRSISMLENRPVRNHHCEQCLRCLHFCPKHAIEYKRNKRENTVGKKRYDHRENEIKNRLSG